MDGVQRTEVSSWSWRVISGEPRFLLQGVNTCILCSDCFSLCLRGKYVNSRDRLTFSKTILKKYLKDSLDRDPSLASPWTVKPSLCVKYGIPLTPDDELQADLTKKKTGAINKRKRNKDDEFPENGEGEDADGKKKKRRRRNSQGVLVDVPDSPTKGGDENSPTNVRRKPIKYPAEGIVCFLVSFFS